MSDYKKSKMILSVKYIGYDNYDDTKQYIMKNKKIYFLNVEDYENDEFIANLDFDSFNEELKNINRCLFLRICGIEYLGISRKDAYLAIYISPLFFEYDVLYYIYDINEAMQIVECLYKANKINIDRYTELKLTKDFSDFELSL